MVLPKTLTLTSRLYCFPPYTPSNVDVAVLCESAKILTPVPSAFNILADLVSFAVADFVVSTTIKYPVFPKSSTKNPIPADDACELIFESKNTLVPNA